MASACIKPRYVVRIDDIIQQKWHFCGSGPELGQRSLTALPGTAFIVSKTCPVVEQCSFSVYKINSKRSIMLR